MMKLKTKNFFYLFILIIFKIQIIMVYLLFKEFLNNQNGKDNSYFYIFVLTLF